MLTKTRRMAAKMSLEESLAILEAKFVDNGWAFLAELVVQHNIDWFLVLIKLWECTKGPSSFPTDRIRSGEWESRTVEDVSPHIRHSLGEWCTIRDEFCDNPPCAIMSFSSVWFTRRSWAFWRKPSKLHLSRGSEGSCQGPLPRRASHRVETRPWRKFGTHVYTHAYITIQIA